MSAINTSGERQDYSVIIDNPYTGRSSLGPDKADPKLIIDPNAVLTCPIPFQGFKAIAWRKTQRFQRDSGV
jgi:hypothetical protein